MWLVVITWLLLWEFSASKVTFLQLPFSSDASSAEHEIVEGELEWELGKKSPNPNEGDWKGKLGDQWKHPSPVGKLMNLKRSYCWWKTSQPHDGRLKKKTGQGSIDEKHLELDEKMCEKNRKVVSLMKKPSNLDLGQRRKNQKMY